MFKKFLSYYKPHLKMFILDMFASLFISIIGMTYPIITRSMLNDFIPNKNIMMIVVFGCTLLVLYVIRMMFRYFVQYYGHEIGVLMQASMRREMFTKLQKLPYKYFDDHETGKIMSRMTNDLMDVSELAHHGPENILISGVMIILSFVYLCLINWILTIIIFACVPLLVFVSLKSRKKMSEAFMDNRKNMAIINSNLESSITGIRVTKAFNNENKEEVKFEDGNNKFVQSRKKAYKAMAIFFSSTNFITDLFNVIVLLAGGLFLYRGDINFADYSTFILSINLFIAPLTALINFMEQFQNGVTGFKRFLEVMEEKEEGDKDNAITLSEVQGNIKFRDVSFSYIDNKEILDHIDLNIKKGEKLALVGSSGGGKTTLCHLLPRFYEITQGSISIDGVDIKEVTLKSLRDNIGIVQQDVFLFNGTIKENILYGNLNATDEEVVEASKKANIYDYIISLPEGFETKVGERGIKLSGGQKQRLSIARVFLKNPAILILDEATSALDNSTEILIQEALDELCKGRTTLVVAHRLSTIKNATDIVVVDGGKIIEKGTHEQLMEKHGEYEKLYKLQFRNLETVIA